jgi:Ca-activated chloride channel family protein
MEMASNPLRVDVNLVLVPVTVNDAANRTVKGLTKENFTVMEDGEPQQIRHVWREDTPISIGILVDVSGSMAKNIDEVREAVAELFENGNPKDDYFVITFSDRPKLLADTTQSIGTIQANLGATKVGGYTALLDAIYMGIEKLKKARYERHALVIISDGDDNVSRHKLHQVKGMAQESDAQIYAIRILDALPFFKTLQEKMGNRVLSEITGATGGRAIAIESPSELSQAAATISEELRNQYVLAYQAKKSEPDGKWHKLKVRATAQDNTRLHVFAKPGYLAPASFREEVAGP